MEIVILRKRMVHMRHESPKGGTAKKLKTKIANLWVYSIGIRHKSINAPVFRL